MATSRIYLLNQDTKNMRALDESGYVAELELQEFLSQHPDLLPGDQINPDDPRRWLLISREMPVPGDDVETGRWSLDHLFVDQDGIPTFVECKRSVDTRIRREVMAQMLDYAANGVEYWGLVAIRHAAEQTAGSSGTSLDERIRLLLQSEEPVDSDQFWSLVEENLRQHRVRLVFVSDDTPRELRRLVEFLNEEMLNVEVIAVDVKQYRSQDRPSEIALVPRVIGLTEAALDRKSRGASTGMKTTREAFLASCTPEAREFFDDLLQRALSDNYTVYWGYKGFSVRAALGEEGRLASFLYGYPPDKFQFYFPGEGALTREKDNPIRKELLRFGIFAESGDYTLASQIRGEKLAEYRRLLDYVMTTMRAMTGGAAWSR
jgi:hypothetical protein